MTEPLDARDDHSDVLDDAAYFAGVVAEIEAEAARRTADGDYPGELLQELDRTFRRWIPAGGRSTGIDDAIRAIESASFINAAVPVESSRRVGTAVKTAVRKATYFYHRHMAQQVAALGIQITRPLRLLDATTRQLEQRVAALEDRIDIGVKARTDLLSTLPEPMLDHGTSDLIVRLLQGASGRILVAEVRTDALLQHLADTGLDVYAVGTVSEVRRSLDVHQEQLSAHLDHLEAAALSGAVLIGAPDRLNLNEQVRMIGDMVGKCADGAPIVVIATDPGHWLDQVGPVAADLTDGRPLHPLTWAHLLRHHGVDDVRVVSDPESSVHVIAGTVR